MRKYLILLVASLLMACQGSQAGYVIKGDFANGVDGTAVLAIYGVGYEAGDFTDTVEMRKGKFEFKGEVPRLQQACIDIFPAGGEGVAEFMFMLENSPVTIKGDWNNAKEGILEGYLEVEGMVIAGSANQSAYAEMMRVPDDVRAMPEHMRYRELEPRLFNDAENLDMAFWEEFQPLREMFDTHVLLEKLSVMAAHPSLVGAACELNAIMDNLSLQELKDAFGRFTPEVQVDAMLAPVRENIALRERIEPGQPATDFSLPQRDGTTLSLADYRGKVLVLDFWASWCGPCRASFPWMREFYKEYQSKGVEILGISIDAKRADWEKALDAEKLPWKQVLDERTDPYANSKVATIYHALAIPHFVVIDREGKIVACRHMEQAEFKVLIDKLLGK